MKINKYLLLLLIFFSASVNAGQILLSGAASLTDAFKSMVNQYQQAHPETEISTSFAASDIVLQQVINGAPINIFASADQQTMDKAESLGLIDADSRVDFALNKLVLIVPKKDNLPYEIQSLNDLLDLAAKDNNLKVAIANPETVPAGRYTKQALKNDWDVISKKQITGQNVRQILSYVQTAEVDAGFVFASDAHIAKDKVKIVAELQLDEPILYPIALIKHTADEQSARESQEFIQFVLSDKGQEILNEYGFVALK